MHDSDSSSNGRMLLPYVGVNAALSGACSAIAGGILAFPLEKVVLRRDGLLNKGIAEGRYARLGSGLAAIWLSEGKWRGLYRGLILHATRSLTTTAPLLIIDEALRSETRWVRDSCGVVVHEAAAGAAAGFASGVLHWPFDKVRTNLQLEAALGSRDRRWLRNAVAFWRLSGLRDIYQGCGKSIAHSTFRAGVLFSGANSFAAALQQHDLCGPCVSVALGTAGSSTLAVVLSQFLYLQKPAAFFEFLQGMRLSTMVTLPPMVLSLTLLEIAKRSGGLVVCEGS